MTNQDAIEVLNVYKKRLENSCSNQLDEDIESFNIAINAVRLVTVINTLFKDDVAKHIDKATFNLLHEYFMN